MIKAIAVVGFIVSLAGVASAQIAPPPGAVTHQGTKPVPTAHKLTTKKTHPSKTMSNMKATPKPKP